MSFFVYLFDYPLKFYSFGFPFFEGFCFLTKWKVFLLFLVEKGHVGFLSVFLHCHLLMDIRREFVQLFLEAEGFVIDLWWFIFV